MKQPVTHRDVKMSQHVSNLSTGSSHAIHCDGLLSLFNMTILMATGSITDVTFDAKLQSSNLRTGAQYDLIQVLLLHLMATCADVCRPCKAPTKIVTNPKMSEAKYNFYT